MIGKILRTMRRESGFTQKEISYKTFIGRSTLSDYEREKTDISFEDIIDSVKIIVNILEETLITV